jgi:hypothetical protein
MIGPLVTCHALRVTFSVDCLPREMSAAYFTGLDTRTSHLATDCQLSTDDCQLSTK